MNAAAPEPSIPALRRLLRFTAIAAIVLIALVAVLAWLMQPPRATGFLLRKAGDALGLDIRAGKSDYRLRGTPQLVLHDVVAQRPGDKAAMLRAERVFVSLPWSTIRARGGDLTVQRIELDAPVLDVPALQRWLATRPPSETRIPTLRDGLRVERGRIDNDDWIIDGIDVALPSLSPATAVRTSLRGRYLDPPTKIPFDLDIALSKPVNGAGIAAIGGIAIEGEGWRLPARVRLSGPLRLGDDEVRMSPARIGVSARYVSGESVLPFTLGAFGPLLFDEAVWSLDPAALFGSVLYTHNFGRTVRLAAGDPFETEVDPGASAGYTLGLALALTPELGMNVRFEHRFVFPTDVKSQAPGSTTQEVAGSRLSVAIAYVGITWAVTRNTAIDVSVGLGVTEDSPDVTLRFAVPIRFNLW